MDKKPHVKPYLYGMLAGFGAISLSIIFFFLIYRFDGFGDAISTLTGILMPFIYGAVIAYLLKPVCNTIESFLRRFIPEKMHGLVNVLSVTLTILFGLLLIYALCMMIIPQLITSVTTLYYTAQRNLAKFVQWANHVEFIENNQQIMDMLNSAYATISTNIDDLIKTRLLPSMQNIVSGAAVGVLNVVTMAKNLIIGIIVAVYMLASRKRFVQQAKLVLYSIFKPRWAELIKEEVKYADKMFGGFINGKIMDSAIIGVLCYIGCLIFKFPSALLVSVIIGVTNVIPFFGPFIGAVPATLLILIQSPIKALWFVLFVLVLQQLEGVSDMDAARALRGQVFYFDRNDATLPAGRWYVADLIGCEVRDADTGKVYGVVTSVDHPGAQDIYTVKAPGGKEYMFPGVDAFLKERNPPEGYLLVTPIPGLLDDDFDSEREEE